MIPISVSCVRKCQGREAQNLGIWTIGSFLVGMISKYIYKDFQRSLLPLTDSNGLNDRKDADIINPISYSSKSYVERCKKVGKKKAAGRIRTKEFGLLKPYISLSSSRFVESRRYQLATGTTDPPLLWPLVECSQFAAYMSPTAADGGT